MQEAFQTNCYIDIIGQYSKNKSEYSEEMEISGAFYSFTYNALVVAAFMELAKIFDSHKDSNNIKQLMDICKENIELFPQERKMVLFGEEEICPYRHTVLSEEEFFKREIELQKPFNELVGGEKSPVTVDMSRERYFEFFAWKYKKIEPQIQKLLRQRNKIYAHNDKNTLRNMDKTIEKFPLSTNDVETLTKFAIEFSQFVIALLTGIYKASAPVNIDDWQSTLRLVKLGKKYKDLDIENN